MLSVYTQALLRRDSINSKILGNYIHAKSITNIKCASDDKKQLLPKASPSFQMNACAVTLTNLLIVCQGNLNDDEQKMIRKLVFYIRSCLNSSDCNQDYDLAKKIVKTVISVLDIFVMDEMASKYSKNIGVKFYGRAGFLFEEKHAAQPEFSDQPLIILPKGIVRTHYASLEEMSAYLNMLVENSSCLPVCSVAELKKLVDLQKKSRFQVYYFLNPMTKREINMALEIRSKHRLTMIIMPFLINDKFGGFALSGKKVEKIDKDTFLPQSEPSRQEILESLLEGGVSIINDLSKIEANTNVIFSKNQNLDLSAALKKLGNIWEIIVSLVPTTDSARYISVKQARLYSMLSDNQKETHATKLEKNIIKEYSKILTNKSDRTKSHIVLTRSGLSATTLGVHIAKLYFVKNNLARPLLYIHPGLYYEAKLLIKRNLDFTKDSTDKNIRIFCINISSNPPYTTLEPRINYSEKRDKIISYVLNQARNNSGNPYFLIIDKTTDLSFKTLPKGVMQPENLFLFEVASLTKYRNGDHNHFSGIAVYKGSRSIKTYIKLGLATAHGTTSLRDLCFFQTVTKGHLKEIIGQLKKKSDIFTKNFGESMKKAPLKLRWRVEKNPDSPQYLFLIPPMPAMILTSTKLGYPHAFYRKKDAKNKKIQLYSYYNLFFKRIIHSVIKPFKITEGFERASSFGLDTTRVSFIPGEFAYNGHFFDQDVPRISLGLKTPLAELKMFGKKVADVLIKHTLRKVKY